MKGSDQGKYFQFDSSPTARKLDNNKETDIKAPNLNSGLDLLLVTEENIKNDSFNIYKNFNEAHSFNKFEVFVKWVESDKPLETKAIYEDVKDFHFRSEYDFEKIFLDENFKVKCLALSPNNKLLAITGDLLPIQIWEINEKQLIGEIDYHFFSNKINCLAMSKTCLFSGGWDKLIREWDIETLEIKKIYSGHEQSILCMTITKDFSKMISGSEDKTIFVWDIGSETSRRFKAHVSPISGILITSNNNLLISASWDKTIKLWNFNDFSNQGTLKGHKDAIRTIALSPSDKILASGGRDKLIKIWDLETKHIKCTFNEHSGTISSLKFSLYGEYLISSSLDKTIKVWSIQKLKIKKSINAHNDEISCLETITQEDGKFISASFDSSIKIWKFENETEFRPMDIEKEGFTALGVFPDNIRAITCQRNNLVKIWDYNKDKVLATIWEQNIPTTVGITQDGKYLITGDNEGDIIFWDTVNYFKLKHEKAHDKPIFCVKIFDKHNVFITVGKDNIIILWSLSVDNLSPLKKEYFKDVTAVEVHNLSNLILISCLDNMIYLINHNDLKILGKLQAHDKEITCLKSLEYTCKFVSGSLDQKLKIWNLRNFSIEVTIETELEIFAAELNRDESAIISSHSDNTIRIWDIETRELIGRSKSYPNSLKTIALSAQFDIILCFGENSNEIKKIYTDKLKVKQILDDQKSIINDIALSEDNKLLAASSDDLKITLYDAERMKVIKVFEGHTKLINLLSFTPNSKHLIAAGEHHSIKVWDLEDEKYDSFLLHSPSIADFGVYENGNKLLTACEDESLMLFDIDQRKLIKTTFVRDHKFIKLVINNKESCFYVGTKKGYLFEFDLGSLKKTKAINVGTKSVKSMCLSPNDTEIFISCGNDVSVWKIKEEKFTLIGNLTGHSLKINSLAINSQGTKLYSGSFDQKIFIWDVSNMKKIGELEEHSGPIRKILLSKDEYQDTLYSCSEDKTIRAWNLKDSKQIPFLNGHMANINHLCFSPDNKYLISGDQNDSLIVWDLSKMKLKHTLTNNENCFIQGIAVTSDSSKIISCTNKFKKTIWDLESGKKIGNFEFNSAYPFKMILIDDKTLLISYSDLKIRAWNLEKLSIEKTFIGHHGNILDLLFLKKDRTIASCSEDHSIIIWNYWAEKPKTILKEHEGYVTTLATNSSESLMFTADSIKKIFVWDLITNKLIKKIEDLKGPVTQLKVSLDDQKLYAIWRHEDNEDDDNYLNDSDQCLLIWSLKNYQSIENKEIYGTDAMALSFDPTELATAQNKTIYLWNYRNLKHPYMLSGTLSSITAETMTPNKEKIILADDENSILVWDVVHKRKIAKFQGHTDYISHLIATSTNIVISAGSDKTIKLWSITDKKLIDSLETHLAPVNAIAISKNEEFLLSTSSKTGIILWDLITKQQIRTFPTNEDFINGLYIYPDNKAFLTAGDDCMLNLWNLENEYEKPKTIIIFNEEVSKIIMSPDMNILLVFTDCIMQIWDMKNYTLITEIDYPYERVSPPFFLSEFNNRLIMLANQMIDCFTGKVIFSFIPNEEICSYFYDYKNKIFFFISSAFRLYEFNQNWLATYFYNFLTFDSIISLKRNINEICNRQMSTFPNFFSFLHLASIYENNEEFSLEKMEQIYPEKNTFFNNFFNLDIFSNTPLDILIQKKNTTLMMKYFRMFFEAIEKESVTFFQKARFYNYNFKTNHNFSKLLCEVISSMGGNLTFISLLLDHAFIEFDKSIYDNSLLFQELQKPIYIEADSLYLNKDFLKLKLEEYFSKKKKSNQEYKSLVKAKILIIPEIFDLNNESTNEFYELIANQSKENQIYTNQTLSMLVNYIWENQIQSYYIIEFIFFFFFFLIFNINFLILYDDDQENLNSIQINISKVFDILLCFYSIFSLVNEITQMRQNKSNYFKSVWNYFDIALVPLLMLSSFYDFALHYTDFDNIIYIKLLFAICMFAFWFRLLSFSRGFKETSSMINLILEVISGVKNFVFFMVIFMCTLSSSFFVMRSSDEDSGFWDTFLVFYSSAVGDASGITDYDLIFPNLDEIYMIMATFLFAIIAVNLLVSLIGDKHNENKENEEKTRTAELLYIITDIPLSLVSQITRKIRGKEKNGKYLIKLFNQDNEFEEEVDKNKVLLEKVEKLIDIISEKNEEIDKKWSESNSAIIQTLENAKNESNMKFTELKEMIENLKK